MNCGVLNHEYSEEFDRLRKNRVEVAFYKYGAARDNFGSGRVDDLATAELCLEAFKKDHNTEHLLDAANYLMFRYMYPMDGEHFTATDSFGSGHSYERFKTILKSMSSRINEQMSMDHMTDTLQAVSQEYAGEMTTLTQ